MNTSFIVLGIFLLSLLDPPFDLCGAIEGPRVSSTSFQGREMACHSCRPAGHVSLHQSIVENRKESGWLNKSCCKQFPCRVGQYTGTLAHTIVRKSCRFSPFCSQRTRASTSLLTCASGAPLRLNVLHLYVQYLIPNTTYIMNTVPFNNCCH